MHIKIADRTFTTANGPIVHTVESLLATVPNWLFWNTVTAESVTKDGSDLVASWLTKTGLGAADSAFEESTTTNKPLFVADTANGRPGLDFTVGNPAALRWNKNMPDGAGTKWSKIWMGVIPATGVVQHLMSLTSVHSLFVGANGVLQASASGIGPVGTDNPTGLDPVLIITSYDEDAGRVRIKVNNRTTEELSATPSAITSSSCMLGVGAAGKSDGNDFEGDLLAAGIAQTDLLDVSNATALANIQTVANQLFEIDMTP